MSWLLPQPDRTQLLADLGELFAVRVARHGTASARRWYVRQLFGLLLRLPAARRTRSMVQRRGELRAGRFQRTGTVLVEAVRGLRRHRVHALTIMSTLGIGVGGAVAVYTLANGVLLRPVPGVTSPHELMTVRLESIADPESGWPLSHVDYEALRSRPTSLRDLAAASSLNVHVAGTGDVPERLQAQIVTPNYFDVLGVHPAAGRPLSSGGGEESRMVVVSHRLARRAFGSAPAALGVDLTINGGPYTIAGVAPSDFAGHGPLRGADLWLPASAAPELLHSPGVLVDEMRQTWPELIGRPRVRVSVERVSHELTIAMESLRAEGVAPFLGMADVRMRAHPGIGLTPHARAELGRTLRILAMAAGLLLLLTCVNATNIGLVRAVSTRREVAVQRALGAGSWRLICVRVIEGALLGLGGAIVGIAAARFGVRAWEAGGFPGVNGNIETLRMDLNVFAFAAAVSILSGIAIAVLPAAAVSGSREGELLRGGQEGDRRGHHMRDALVVVQVALSAVLVISAGLLGRTLYNLRAIDVGVPVDGVVSFAVDPGLQGYGAQEQRTLVTRVLNDIAGFTGVQAVGAIAPAPFAGFRMSAVLIDPTDASGRVPFSRFQITPGALEALGMHLVAGESFREGAGLDTAAERVAILNEHAVRTLFPGATAQDAVGRTVQQLRGRGASVDVRITGIVRDARVDRLTGDAESLFIEPWPQGSAGRSFSVYLRTNRDPDALLGEIPAIMRRIDPDLPPYDVMTLRQHVDALTIEQRFVASLGGLLAILGVSLAMLGLYSVLARNVGARTREIGIRAALGARPLRLMRNVMLHGLALTLVGSVIGLTVASWSTSVLESRLFGVERLDPLTYAAGAIVLAAVALIAAAVPARRAAGVDPARALRET